jgi:multidrug efflux pump subunit AcrA (membrane-fusion protein)
VVFQTNDEKRYLHGGLMRCYDKVREFASYKIEHVDIPWNGTIISGNLHLAPGDGPKPLVFCIDPSSPTTGAVRPVEVALGAAVEGHVAVRGGLEPGMLVVVRGNERLRPGMLVTFAPPTE